VKIYIKVHALPCYADETANCPTGPTLLPAAEAFGDR